MLKFTYKTDLFYLKNRAPLPENNTNVQIIKRINYYFNFMSESIFLRSKVEKVRGNVQSLKGDKERPLEINKLFKRNKDSILEGGNRVD